jgi:hypothetical protein
MPKQHMIAATLSAESNLTVSADVLKQAVQTDLDAQRKAAEIALQEAQKIDATLKSSQVQYPELKEAMDALLKVAQMLASNATATSTAVLNIVSPAAAELKIESAAPELNIESSGAAGQASNE